MCYKRHCSASAFEPSHLLLHHEPGDGDVPVERHPVRRRVPVLVALLKDTGPVAVVEVLHLQGKEGIPCFN